MMRITEILAGWWKKSAQRPFFVLFLFSFIFLAGAVVETSHLLVPHNFIMFVESKSNQGPNSRHKVHRVGVACFPVLSFYLALFAGFWLMCEDSARSKDFACSKDFAGSKEDIKLKYINKDLDCVNLLIIFFSNIYITATFTSLEWRKKSIDCQIIFL